MKRDEIIEMVLAKFDEKNTSENMDAFSLCRIHHTRIHGDSEKSMYALVSPGDERAVKILSFASDAEAIKSLREDHTEGRRKLAAVLELAPEPVLERIGKCVAEGGDWKLGFDCD